MSSSSVKSNLVSKKLCSALISIFIFIQTADSPAQALASQNEDPRIVITAAIKAGSYYSDDFTISGKVLGAGIKDAAIYVGGQRLSTPSLKTRYQNPKNNKFKFTIDASEEPELRIVTDSGLILIEKIDVLDYRS